MFFQNLTHQCYTREKEENMSAPNTPKMMANKPKQEQIYSDFQKIAKDLQDDKISEWKYDRRKKAIILRRTKLKDRIYKSLRQAKNRIVRKEKELEAGLSDSPKNKEIMSSIFEQQNKTQGKIIENIAELTKTQQKWTTEQQNELNRLDATMRTLIFNLNCKVESLAQEIFKINRKESHVSEDVDMTKDKNENDKQTKADEEQKIHKIQQEDANTQAKLEFLYKMIQEQNKMIEEMKNKLDENKNFKETKRISRKIKKKKGSPNSYKHELNYNIFSQELKTTKLEIKNELSQQQSVNSKHMKLSTVTKLRREYEQDLKLLKTEIENKAAIQETQMIDRINNKVQKIEGDINSLITQNELSIKQKELKINNKIKNVKEEIDNLIRRKLDQDTYNLEINQKMNVLKASYKADILEKENHLLNKIKEFREAYLTKEEITEITKAQTKEIDEVNKKLKNLLSRIEDMEKELNAKPSQLKIDTIKIKILKEVAANKQEADKLINELNDEIEELQRKDEQAKELYNTDKKDLDKKIKDQDKVLVTLQNQIKELNNYRKQQEEDKNEVKQEDIVSLQQEIRGKYDWCKNKIEALNKEIKDEIENTKQQQEKRVDALELSIAETIQDRLAKEDLKKDKTKNDTEVIKEYIKDQLANIKEEHINEIKQVEQKFNNLYIKLKDEFNQHMQEIIQTAKSSKKSNVNKNKNKNKKANDKKKGETEEKEAMDVILKDLKENIEILKEKVEGKEILNEQLKTKTDHCCQWCTNNLQEIKEDIQDIRQTIAAMELMEELKSKNDPDKDRHLNKEVHEIEEFKEENNKCCKWCTEAITELDSILQEKVDELKAFAVEKAENFTKEATAKYKIFEEIIDELINEHREQVKNFQDNMEKKCQEIINDKLEVQKKAVLHELKIVKEEPKQIKESYQPKLNILILQKYKQDPAKREYAIKRQFIEYKIAKAEFKRTDIKFPDLKEDEWEALSIEEKIIILNLQNLETEQDIDVLIQEIEAMPRITSKEELINKIIKNINKYNPNLTMQNRKLINEEWQKFNVQMKELQEKVNLLSAKKVEGGKIIIDPEYKAQQQMYNDRVLVLAKECLKNKNLRDFNKKSYAEYLLINEITQKTKKKKFNLIYDSEWEPKSLAEKLFWTNTNVIESKEDIKKLGEIIDKFQFQNKDTMKKVLEKLYEKYYCREVIERSDQKKDSINDLNEQKIDLIKKEELHKSKPTQEIKTKNNVNKIRVWTTEEDYIEFDKEYVDYIEDIITYELQDKEIQMLKDYQIHDNQINEQVRQEQLKYEEKWGIKKQDWYPDQEYDEQINTNTEIYEQAVIDQKLINKLDQEANNKIIKEQQVKTEADNEHTHDDYYNRNYVYRQRAKFNSKRKFNHYNTRKFNYYRDGEFNYYRARRHNTYKRNNIYVGDNDNKIDRRREYRHVCNLVWQNQNEGSYYCTICHKQRNAHRGKNF